MLNNNKNSLIGFEIYIEVYMFHFILYVKVLLYHIIPQFSPFIRGFYFFPAGDLALMHYLFSGQIGPDQKSIRP